MVGSLSDGRLCSQLEEMVSDLRREKDLLRQANERLIQSTFDASRAQHVQELLVSACSVLPFLPYSYCACFKMHGYTLVVCLTCQPIDLLCPYCQERVGELEGREHAEKVEKKRLIEKCAAERGT